MDPNNAVAVITHEEKEVGRCAVNARGSQDFIDGLISEYGSINIDVIEDATFAMIDRMSRGGAR